MFVCVFVTTYIVILLHHLHVYTKCYLDFCATIMVTISHVLAIIRHCKQIFYHFKCYLGCEDIIIEGLTLENLVAILNWGLEPHGSLWVHRQALHFLREEFIQVVHSSVLYDLSKDYLVQALHSDFLQVSCDYTSVTVHVTLQCVVRPQ